MMGYGIRFDVQPADVQRRTPCDVFVRRDRPRPPSKAAGRKGTRRAWKRKHPPRDVFTYREPTDVIRFVGRPLNPCDPYGETEPDTLLVTPRQHCEMMAQIRKETEELRRPPPDEFGLGFGF